MGSSLVACSDGDDSAADTTLAAPVVAPLALSEIAVAVSAVEADLGGAQQFTEINVGPELVNVFVALPDGTELAYVYRDGSLEPPPAPTPQPEGAVLFGLDGIDLTAAEGFDDLLAEELPDSALAGMSLTGAAAGGAQWTATLVGAKGGVFDVLISPGGQIMGALPR